MKNSELTDPIFDELRELPRDTARPGFTRDLLLRIAERETVNERMAAPRLVWIAASLVAVTVVAAGVYERQRERRELRGEVSTLRQEQLLLEREMEALRAVRRDLPVVYLGGDERNDYVLTLNETPRR